MGPRARVVIQLLLVPLAAWGRICGTQDAAANEPPSRATRRLTYVESSTGLVPPTLEGGGTEVEMGDVDGDGRLDLVSIGDHGSPYVNTDQHGVMVWFGDGAGSWSVVMVGEFGYGGVALGDVNGDGHVDLCAFGSGQGRIWAGDGSGGWAEAASFMTPSPGDFEAFRAGGDVDHNGYPDLVLVADEGSWPNDRNHIHVFKESSSPAALSVTPVDPSGGEKLVAGVVTFVDWITAIPAGVPGAVSLELSLDGPAGPWAPIASEIPNSGRFQWRVPPDTPSSSGAFLRLSLTVGPDTVTAITPQPFTILGGDVLFADGFESGDSSAWSAVEP